MKSYICVIDEGTTGVSVSLVSREGEIAFRYDEDFPQYYPKSGWVEHDVNEIWRAVLSGLKACQDFVQGQGSASIEALGITNQRETVALWDRETGKPLSRAIVWQCRRTEDTCLKLKRKGLETKIHRKTGLVIDPYFSATKIKWLIDHLGLSPRDLDKVRAGTIDTFLISRLTGGESFFTDVTNASRTQLLNIKSLGWDKKLSRIFGVPLNILPHVQASGADYGQTRGLKVFPDGVPIRGVIGDQQSALFGQLAFKQGQAKCTFGTGSFIVLNTGLKPTYSKRGLLTTVAWKESDSAPVHYALEGGAFNCGSVIQWLKESLGLIQATEDVERLAETVKDSGGVFFVPALTGLGAPHWEPNARGVLGGLSRGSTGAHIARAALEGIALQNVDILELMVSESELKLKSLSVDGGATKNNLLMQIQSDLLGLTICRPKNIETTTMGAAFMAGLAIGFWSSKENLTKSLVTDRIFTPSLTSRLRRARLREWQMQVKLSVPKS